LLNIHRQAGKSLMVALKCLHDVLFFPPALDLIVCPSQRQAQEVYEKVRQAMNILGSLVPPVEHETLTWLRFANGSRIVTLPASEGTIRGYSAPHRIVMDEASRIPELVFHALRPMLATTQGAAEGSAGLVPEGEVEVGEGYQVEALGGLALQPRQRRGYMDYLSTPNGKQGTFWRTWDRPRGWETLKATVNESRRISGEWIAQERARTPRHIWAQEYECEFTETDQQVFRYDDVERALSVDVEPLFAVPSPVLPAPLFAEDVAPLEVL
jgi:hypothetical protein